MLDVVIWRAVSRFFLCAALPIKQACMRNSSKPKFKRCGTHDGGKHFPSLFLFLDRLLYHGLSHIQGSKKEDNKRNHTRDLLNCEWSLERGTPRSWNAKDQLSSAWKCFISLMSLFNYLLDAVWRLPFSSLLHYLSLQLLYCPFSTAVRVEVSMSLIY